MVSGEAVTIPLAYDLAWLVIILLHLVLSVGVFVYEFRRRGTGSAVGWALMVFLLPLVGFLIFVFARWWKNRS
ncbi:hypothetical membrane protein [Corynebacterium renale]|uniref:Phospholipase D-like protein n=1 Tax=Corynebacterium renale TaxID=1724 RepID=A0A2A9DNS3_9CORY|nr:phospholipase D-like protein [Corynebacterium renale]SQI23126.1 hypothetical membrane protein [Corynebacterium renale]